MVDKHREKLQLAGLDQRQRRREIGELHRDVAAGNVGQSRNRALVRNVTHLDARRDLELLGEDLMRRAVAGRCIGQRIRLRLGERDQIVHGIDRQRRRDDQSRIW